MGCGILALKKYGMWDIGSKKLWDVGYWTPCHPPPICSNSFPFVGILIQRWGWGGHRNYKVNLGQRHFEFIQGHS